MKSMAGIASLTASVALVAALATGCGKSSDGSFVKKAGEKVENALNIKVTVEPQKPIKTDLSDAAKAAGLSMNAAQPVLVAQSGNASGLTVYLISSKKSSGQFVAKALDKDGKEIGRSVVDFELGSDDARYFNFSFPSEMDSKKVDSFLIDIKS